MATTRIIPMHTGKGRSFHKAISDIIDYSENPQKTDNGRLLSSYGCDSRTADEEFTLAKRQYIQKTGRVRGTDDVIAYQVRQSFAPGEITPEEANRLGVEFAQRFTKGRQAFVVCTHVDRAHIHNHIIWSAVNLDCDRKFRNFWGSTRAMRRLNDTICIENGYSIVENPKPHGKSYNKWLGEDKKPSQREQLCALIDESLTQKPADFDALLKLLADAGCEVSRRGKTMRLKAPGWKGFVRMDTLGQGYDEPELKAVLSGTKAHTPKKNPAKAKAEKTSAATVRYNELSGQIKAAEKRMAEIAVLKTHIINYAKTREVYVTYRKAGYSKKFLAEHEADILLHKAAKAAFDEMSIKKLPTVKALQTEYAQLLEEKKKAYGEYRKAREEMQELQTAKANVDRLLRTEEPAQEKEKKPQR